VTSTDIKGPDDDDYVMCDVRTGWENVRMPATRETQCSNGMQNIIFNSDKTIWDTGGQQINKRQWTGASVARTKTGAGGRDSGVKETCAPVAWGSGGEAWTLVARTMDAGGMENGGWRQCIFRKKKKLNRVPVHKK